MDEPPFDAWITRLATTPLPRATVLRGLAASAAAVVRVTVGVIPEAAEARKLGNVKRVKICDCANGQAESCHQIKLIKKKARKRLRRNPCAYRGGCTGESGCAVAVCPHPPDAPPSSLPLSCG